MKYSTIGEASSVVQFAEIVDNTWNLARKNCDGLCHNYEQMCEWSMKLCLERWNSEKDSTIMQDKYNHEMKTSRIIEAGKRKERHYFVRYPITHNLYDLHKLVGQRTGFSAVCAPISLNRITSCAHSTTSDPKALDEDITFPNPTERISCREFWEHAQVVDEYLLKLWAWMKTTEMTPNYHPLQASMHSEFRRKKKMTER